MPEETNSPAEFQLSDFLFLNAKFNFDTPDKTKYHVSINPTGNLVLKEKQFYLDIYFSIIYVEDKEPSIECTVRGIFSFNKISSIEEIPEYFYANSVAILYPYIRSFVSTLTSSSNNGHILLPTLNLSSMGKVLKENTLER